MSWLKKKKIPLEKIGEGVYLKDGEIFFRHTRYSDYRKDEVYYRSLDSKLRSVLIRGSHVEDFEPYKNLTNRLLDWKLSEEYEKKIIKRAKEILKEWSEEETKSQKKFKDKLKLVRKIKNEK